MMETGSTPQPAQQAALRIRQTANSARTRGPSDLPRRAPNARPLPAPTPDLDASRLEPAHDTMDGTAGHVMIRQMGNRMRHLYPSHGVYEVPGRMGRDELAALTTCPEYASRGAIMLRAGRRPTRSGDLPAP